jgi:hypothetical protein
MLTYLYSGLRLDRERFVNYVMENYEGKDFNILLEKLDEIPWDEDGYVSLNWIFGAKWFNTTPRYSKYGYRFENEWGGMVLQLVLHEAFKHYLEQEEGAGIFGKLVKFYVYKFFQEEGILKHLF